MLHYNGNIPCVINLKLTGYDPLVNDIIELSLLPLDYDLTISKKYSCLHLIIKPNNLGIDSKMCTKPEMKNSQMNGCDSLEVSDILIKWFEGLKLPRYKQFMLIGFQTSSYIPLLCNLIGKNHVDYLFHPYIRDLQAATLFLNDRAGFYNEHYPYNKNTYRYIMSTSKIFNQESDALSICRNIAEAYRRVCLTLMLPMLEVTSNVQQPVLSDRNIDENAEDCSQPTS